MTLACAGCRYGFDARQPSGDARPDSAPGFVAIGGAVSGLVGSGLVLKDNGGDDLAIDVNGPFTFATPLVAGGGYAVTIGAPPAGQGCVIANGNGIASTDVADIAVSCFPIGACPTTAVTFTSSGVFTLPVGCTSMIVDAYGGGGAGGARHMGTAAAAGGNGGHARRTLAGQPAGAAYSITIGLGGSCDSTAMTLGGYAGGGGGHAGGSGNGADGAGNAIGGAGGAGSTGTQPGGAGGAGKFGGGGGGGGGDTAPGNSGGGATSFQPMATGMDAVVAGGGGGAGAADQNGDVAGAGGNACTGLATGAAGGAAIAGMRSAGGGGGGVCDCLAGTCDMTPTPDGGAGGAAGTAGSCTAAQDGLPGQLTITFP